LRLWKRTERVTNCDNEKHVTIGLMMRSRDDAETACLVGAAAVAHGKKRRRQHARASTSKKVHSSCQQVAPTDDGGKRSAGEDSEGQRDDALEPGNQLAGGAFSKPNGGGSVFFSFTTDVKDDPRLHRLLNEAAPKDDPLRKKAKHDGGPLDLLATVAGQRRAENEQQRRLLENDEQQRASITRPPFSSRAMPPPTKDALRAPAAFAPPAAPRASQPRPEQPLFVPVKPTTTTTTADAPPTTTPRIAAAATPFPLPRFGDFPPFALGPLSPPPPLAAFSATVGAQQKHTFVGAQQKHTFVVPPFFMLPPPPIS